MSGSYYQERSKRSAALVKRASRTDGRNQQWRRSQRSYWRSGKEERTDIEDSLANGQPGYEVVMQMIKHEMHHHGQLIKFFYYLGLPIPESWQDEWVLSRDE